ncbi:hypothetical protein [uncultured Desulfovibrio sp.]|uniref:hypothetical protein n=1 Tax=uncultured Desulfovibrio sp. TaxID=167968 RepID=UPI00262A3556|nr:hypothetical protein [uncultured Desulfovibrio sp.]
MKLKITKDANDCYSLWKVTGAGWFGLGDKWPVISSKNASVVLDEMRRILGSSIETGLLDVECVKEEA